MPEVPGCPEAVALNAVRNACVEFCKSTDIWPAILPIASLANIPSYPLTPPVGADISNVLVVSYNDRVIDPESETDLDQHLPGWRTATNESANKFTIDRAATPIALRLSPIPTITGTITVNVSLKPTPNSTGVGDIIYRDWHEAIAMGALGRLMRMKQKPWSNDIEAMSKDEMFRSEMSDARISVIKGHSKQSLYVEIPKFI